MANDNDVLVSGIASRLKAIAENLDDRTFYHDHDRAVLDIGFLRIAGEKLQSLQSASESKAVALDAMVDSLERAVETTMEDAEVDYPIGHHKGMHQVSWDAGALRAALIAALSTGQVNDFQGRVAAAHGPLFDGDSTDLAERRDRFFEEAAETVQALDMTENDAHELVAYTFRRPPGDVRKEIGAAALTLASLCVIGGWDMMACAEADLEKLQQPETIDRIRAKRASRHGRGALPGIDPGAVSSRETGR